MIFQRWETSNRKYLDQFSAVVAVVEQFDSAKETGNQLVEISKDDLNNGGNDASSQDSSSDTQI